MTGGRTFDPSSADPYAAASGAIVLRGWLPDVNLLKTVENRRPIAAFDLLRRRTQSFAERYGYARQRRS
jgi:hypothetical protein